MELLERGDVAATIYAPVRVESLRFVLDGELEGVMRAGQWAFSAEWLGELEGTLRAELQGADPLDPGVTPPSESWAADVLPLLPFERRGARLYFPDAQASLGERAEDAETLERALAAAGVRATKLEDDELVRFLESSGRLVRLGEAHAIGAREYEVAKDVMLGECRASGEITLARFRDLVGVGRRDAQLLLERFDQDGLTRRVGDRRVLRRAATRSE